MQVVINSNYNNLQYRVDRLESEISDLSYNPTITRLVSRIELLETQIINLQTNVIELTQKLKNVGDTHVQEGLGI